ncbi:MAG: hypothetical protein JWQ90_5576 [Hydrocarboniphaga sp.]|uniref:hypothetical protein n=1 Tax=Hydrocarboniphaga sp. TaxID=2033016 RepID=UPI00260E2A89|nr:hypothetical protein [Hydrocarboniphaga sp.]MDB5973126.1 hypothetical protein [Hydrocarboniphaga sp.]
MTRQLIRLSLLLMALLAPSIAIAQTQPKAPKSPPPDNDQPALSTSLGAAPAPSAGSAGGVKTGGTTSGTNIIGERESPIGLYITPWRNAAAEADIDRPARLLSVQLEPLDRRVFARQVEYYEALAAAQKAKTGPAPSTPPPQP